MKYGFGVDLGGTTVKLAFFNNEGDMLHKWEIPTNTAEGGKYILPDIAAAVSEYLKSKNISKEQIIGIGIGVATAGVFAVFSREILTLFTKDPEMIRLVSLLLIVDIFLEVGRVSNLVFGIALKTSGDATYPMIVAVTFAFLCAAGGTWLFGVKLGWLVVGAYVAMALDECVRALFMFLRWKSGKWQEKSLLK